MMQMKWLVRTAVLALLAVPAVFSQGGRSGAPPAGTPEPAILEGMYPGTAAVSQQVAQQSRLEFVAPEYPAVARQAAIQGEVWLGVLIGVDGHVENINVVSGAAMLRQAAMDAVRQWTYRPMALNGQVVPVATYVVVNFQLL
jgi:protein TonB